MRRRELKVFQQLTRRTRFTEAVLHPDPDERQRFEFAEQFRDHPLGDLHTFAGFDQIRAWEKEYLGEEAMKKYAGTVGHQPK